MKKLIIFLAIVVVTIVGLFYFLEDNKKASIEFVFPKSGDAIETNSLQTLKWKSKNIPSSNKISITIRRVPPPPLQEEGQEFDPIIFINLPNTGSQEWSVSDTYPEGNYILEINSYADIPVTNPISAESEVFKINKSAIGLKCHDSPKYFAIQKNLDPNVGSNILIKYKNNPDQDFPCTYTVANSDFEIKNISAEYFLTFTDNFLVLDSGTAPPPRGLIVYDLRSQNKVMSDTYTKPVIVEGDNITYFSKTSIKPNLQNCSDLENYLQNGLGAVIMSKVTVDLLTLQKKDLGITECIATQ